MQYKMVALDLDGTLLPHNLELSERVEATLARVQARGVWVTIASGRGYPSLLPWVERLHIAAPVVGYQGARVTDPATHRTVRDYPFSSDLIPELVAYARAQDLSLTLYHDDEIYSEEKRQSDDFYDRWFGLPVHLVPSLLGALPGDPTKFLITDEPARLDCLQPDIEARFTGKLQIVRSHPLFIEGLASGISKASALAWICEQAGFSAGEVIAIGDSGNDVEMLRWAGVGVAMGNASPDALAAADLVAPSVDDDGVAHILGKLVLGEG